MDSDLTQLYRTLGYKGPTTEADITPSPAAATSRSRSAREAARARSAEIPPLDLEGLNALEEQLNRSPRQTMARVRDVWDKNVTEAYLRESIDRARTAMRSPETAVVAIEAARTHARAASVLPPGFTFEGIDLDEIPIDLGDTKFETGADALGWVIFAGPFALTKGNKDDFRRHTSDSDFIYDLEEPTPGSPLEIALFSDFGNGRYHARYIAKQLRAKKFPYAIHLGDVYYAGRRSEFKEFFEDLLDPMLGDTSLFALNSNHEMYSGGIPYFEYIDKRARLHPEKQRQQSSYFCLRNSRFQIVGIDTAFFDHGRFKDEGLQQWLRAALSDGRSEGRINILLSADQPYRYGEVKITSLLSKDLAEIVLEDRLVDLWFWGNNHYCALFDRSSTLPFIGSCIGHAGYPYDIERAGKNMPAPLVFLEERARFPKATGLRQDRGNNGYCVLVLKADGSLDLKYIDWMSNLRCKAMLNRLSTAEPPRIIGVDKEV